MTLNVTEAELIEKLLKIIKDLQNEGYLPPNLSPSKINEIISGVKNTLDNNKSFEFTGQDLNNFDKALRVACVAEYVNPHLEEDKRIDYSFLFQDKKVLDKDKNQNNVKKQIGNLLEAILKLRPQFKQNINRDELRDDLIPQMQRSRDQTGIDKLAKDVKTTALLMAFLDLIKEGFRQLYGVDPQGGLKAPVLSVRGNLMNFSNFATLLGDSNFYMEDELQPIAALGAEREEPGLGAAQQKPDLNPLTKGIEEFLMDTPDITAEALLHSSNAPTLHPKG